MKAPIQILPPSNWQDFEELCKRIWENKWNYPEDIIKNGRIGQNQHGVDICAYVESKKGYCGIQCKGKDNFTNKQLTISEINEEINKAKNFKPDLKSLIFATTAPKDAEIEKYIRECNLENIKNGLFSVAIYSWEDIISLIEQYESVKEWYLYEKLQSYEPEIEILLNGETAIEENPIILNPEYTKQCKFLEYQPRSIYDFASLINRSNIMCPDSYKKGNASKLKFEIKNNGEFLENCIFSVNIQGASSYKFCEESICEKINSPYIIDDFSVQTNKEFSLHSGFAKTFECYVTCSDCPKEENFVIEFWFTSKQNRKPFTKKLFITSIPKIIELPQETIITHEPCANNYIIEVKPKELDS